MLFNQKVEIFAACLHAATVWAVADTGVWDGTETVRLDRIKDRTMKLFQWATKELDKDAV